MSREAAGSDLESGDAGAGFFYTGDLGCTKNRNGGFLSNSNINSSNSNGIEEVTTRIDNSELGIYFLLIHFLC